MEFNDSNVPMECAECSTLVEGIPSMEQHILFNHSDYSPEEAINYAKIWAENAYEQIDAENMWRAEEFRRTGHDPEDVDRN